MKKYKLQDLVSNGKNARRKINSDLLVGDISAGYGYGDILDANAVSELISKMQLEQNAIDAAQTENLQQMIQDAIDQAMESIESGEVKTEVATQELTGPDGDIYAIEFISSPQH